MLRQIHDPVETELNYRPELTFDQRTMLIEWAVKQKYRNAIAIRGTDPEFPGSTYWVLWTGVRVTLWPARQRLWATHNRNPGEIGDMVLRHLAEVMATHPPTRH